MILAMVKNATLFENRSTKSLSPTATHSGICATFRSEYTNAKPQGTEQIAFNCNRNRECHAGDNKKTQWNAYRESI